MTAPTQPLVGDGVHYLFGEAQSSIVGCRAAVIVRTWGPTLTSAVNLQVLLDGSNDGHDMAWLSSRVHAVPVRPDSWHYAEECPQNIETQSDASSAINVTSGTGLLEDEGSIVLNGSTTR